MRLAHRLFLYSLAVILALTATIALILDRKLHVRIEREGVEELAREARFIASQWTADASPLALAHAAGTSLGHRVTLIRTDGVVLGDSQFDSSGIAQLENHAGRPEVHAARTGVVGWSRRTSPSRGDTEIYVAVPAALGVARVSESTATEDAIFHSALRDVLGAGLIAAAIALVLAALFARSVSAPVVELRDIARDIAEGDLTRRPMLSGPGEVGDLASALRQMSEQLGQRLRALHDDETLLSAVIDSLTEGVLAIDSGQHVLRINASAREMLNLRDEVPFPTDRLPRNALLRSVLLDALRGVHTESSELEIAGRVLLLTARPLADGAVLALYDVTHMRRLEAVRRDFVANVSHELRTPLTVIGGFAETLAGEPVSDDDRTRFASRIVASTRRMQRIVDDLLDLSRIESGGWVPQPVEMNVAELAAEVVASYETAAREKGTMLQTHIAAEAQRVYADPVALRQVIGNLVENAVRHTTHGEVTVFAVRDAARVRWVGVRDSGTGIAPEHLPRIFERFYRADEARSRSGGSSGLGLAIVKHLVEAHGGEVYAESVVGGGTTITVSFPQPSKPDVPNADSGSPAVT